MSNVITTMDVAKRVGVARSTVINVLNKKHSSRYSDDTRKKIFEAADEIGYNIDLMARAIKSTLKHIGFVTSGIDGLDTSVMREILNGSERAANEQGYLVMSTGLSNKLYHKLDDCIREANDNTQKIINLISSRILDGLLIDKTRLADPQLELLQKSKVPFVVINSSPVMERQLHQSLYWVGIDHKKGGQIATEYLIGYGHKRIAMIIPAISHYRLYDKNDQIVDFGPGMVLDRSMGYKAALQNSGFEVNDDLIFEASPSERMSLLKVVDQILRLENRPTAIFVADDNMAVLTINYLRERGFKVPGDFSILGYGNLSACYSAVPKLTTVDIPWAEMGYMGFKILVSLLLNKDKEQVEHFNILEPELLEGASVSAPCDRNK
ncbi:MAG: LacI family transcriptional regulator [Planctomycetaceae bacterium]|nr:LacI family transcriptional regulator [Planctomycetaceae bacterium]